MRSSVIAAIAVLSVLAAPATSVKAQMPGSLKIATFNVAWLLDRDGFDRWQAACISVGWNTDSLTPEQSKKLEGLPYCNVHNGLKWPIEKKCPSLTKAEAIQRPLINDKGCRESKDLSKWNTYQEKVASLRSMFSALDKQGVTFVALQEVFSTSAIRAVLPAGWDARTSADIEGAPKIPQHVGIAWKNGTHAPKDWGLESKLVGSGSRPLRPGLVFTDTIAGKPVQFLVVHLKSGCSSNKTAISAPVKDHEKDSCPWLEEQVHVLEHWVDERVNKDFIILGDFNRKLVYEKKTAPDTSARVDPKIGQLFPELNDNDPKGSTLWLAQPRRENGANGQMRTATLCTNGHAGLDHVILSNALYKRVRLGDLQANLISIDGGQPFKKGKPFVATPTDHCPHFVEIAPR